MSQSPLRVALCGLGQMGRLHARALRASRDFDLVATMDPMLPEWQDEAPRYTDLTQLLNAQSLDAVVVAAPTFAHAELTKQLMQAGIPTLVEKPLAGSAAQGQALCNLAQELQAKVAVGHIERFNPVVNALMAELVGKEIYSIQITRVGPFPPRIADVGVLTDLSVHDIDLARYVTGLEITAANIHKSRKIHGNHEDNAVVSLSLQNDVVASITTNWLTPFKKRKIEVATADAYYEANLMSQELIEYSAYNLNNSYVRRDCFVAKAEPLPSQLAAFAHYVRTGEAGRLALCQDALIPLQILEGVHNV